MTTNLMRCATLAVVVVCAVLPLSAAAAAREQTVRLTIDSYEQFDACLRDGNIDVKSQPGTVLLAPTDYVVHEVGNKIGKIGLKATTIARKVWPLSTLGASKAEVYLFGSAARASFNGKPLAFRPARFGGWVMADVDAKLLRRGANELIVTEGTLAFDRERKRPKYSLVSDHTSSAWRPADGEFLARLRLFRHPAKGVITSEVIDLANLEGKDTICPLIEVKELKVRGSGSKPRGTAVAMEARSGSSPVPDRRWTRWGKAVRVEPNRYVQWRATLSTRDRTRTPKLKRVTIEAGVAMLADPQAQGLRAKAFENQKIVRSSYRFAFQRPSKKLAYLREHWKLDEVVAAGKTDLEKFVLLRNWVRRQWPHNDAGSGVRTWDAIEILSAPPGKHGMCVHYGVTFAQCALALGYNARQIILSGHYVADAWSNEYQKWVLMDVECVQKEGWDRYGTALYWDTRRDEPMGSLDLHRAVAENSTQDIVQKMYMTDPDGQHRLYDRTYGAGEYRNFQRFAYPERNNYLDQLEPWEEFHGQDHYHANSHLWWKDGALEISPEYTWRTNRGGDINWTVNQAAITLTATEDPGKLAVTIDTVTPNLKGFIVRVDDGKERLLRGEGRDPNSRRASFTWQLKAGVNRFEARPQNVFGRDGIVSKVVIEKP